MSIKKISGFQTSDGKFFDSEADAILHDVKIRLRGKLSGAKFASNQYVNQVESVLLKEAEAFHALLSEHISAIKSKMKVEKK